MECALPYFLHFQDCDDLLLHDLDQSQIVSPVLWVHHDAKIWASR